MEMAAGGKISPDASPVPAAAPADDGDAPFAKPVPNKPGYIIHPHALDDGYIDVPGYPPRPLHREDVSLAMSPRSGAGMVAGGGSRHVVWLAGAARARALDARGSDSVQAAAGWMAIASLHFAGATTREASTFVPPGETPPEVSTESYLAHVRVREIYLAADEPMIRLDRSKL